MPAPVDFALATKTARRLAPPGPSASLREAEAVVAELRGLAVSAEEYVWRVTGLVPPGDPLPATVVDRGEWAARNIEGFRFVLEPLDLPAPKDPVAAFAGAKLAGVELGGVLAWLSSKVLGQYEAFVPAGTRGELLLVAPNIFDLEARLGLPPRDFRLWVALHEVAHRTQFTAVPWMHDHVRSEIATLLASSNLSDPGVMLERLKGSVSQLGRSSLVEVIATPEQRVVMDRVTAFMSLLEGHAEHVMDEVGPTVVPSVAFIRSRFDEYRSADRGALDRTIRRVLGLDLKAAQYKEGKRFVDAVVSEVGMERFNRVWDSPASLPTLEEVRSPGLWVDRVGRS